MENNLQHVQLPNNMTLDVKPKDLLVYVTIKRHQDSETKKAFPSLVTISAESGASINAVRKSIKDLVKSNYISIEKVRNKNIYSFNEYKNFEPFSYEFLDNKELSCDEKSYILAAQQYMYKDIEGEGKISYTNEELASKINVSERSIIRYNNSLERKGLLTKVKSELRDLETGCAKEIKIFDLNKMLQGIIWILKNHEDRITANEENIELLNSRMNKFENENKELKSKNKELEHENKLLKEGINKLKQSKEYNYTL